MARTFSQSKRPLQAKSLDPRNAIRFAWCYYALMGKPLHDWYLKEWLRACQKKQADIARDLDWNKAKVSLTASGKQPYDRDDINEIADYLNIRPYELLMHPDDAMALRRLRADMVRLAHEADIDNEADHTEPPKKVSAS